MPRDLLRSKQGRSDYGRALNEGPIQDLAGWQQVWMERSGRLTKLDLGGGHWKFGWVRYLQVAMNGTVGGCKQGRLQLKLRGLLQCRPGWSAQAWTLVVGPGLDLEDCGEGVNVVVRKVHQVKLWSISFFQCQLGQLLKKWLRNMVIFGLASSQITTVNTCAIAALNIGVNK